MDKLKKNFLYDMFLINDFFVYSHFLCNINLEFCSSSFGQVWKNLDQSESIRNNIDCFLFTNNARPFWTSRDPIDQ